MGAMGHNTDLTVVNGEGRIEIEVAFPVVSAILPEGLAYSMAELSDRGRDLRAKTEYRCATTAV